MIRTLFESTHHDNIANRPIPNLIFHNSVVNLYNRVGYPAQRISEKAEFSGLRSGIQRRIPIQSKLLVISFDALGTDALDDMLKRPNFRHFAENGTLVRDVPGSFVSNTYPVHASIATGRPPRDHGIISNNRIIPEEAKPRWRYDSREIKVKTIWNAAKEKGLRTAAVLWPVTAYAKDIAYNVPESAAGMGENQVLLNLKTGSKWTQLKAFVRHGKILDGIKQPNLDNFSTLTMLDIIRENKPELMLLHLTGYDTACHEYGVGSKEAGEALDELDRHLGELLAVIEPNTTVVIFSDHSQLNVNRCFDPNTILDEFGYAKRNRDGSLRDARAFFLNADGNAILFNRNLNDEELAQVEARLDAEKVVERKLTDAEMTIAGFIPERIETLAEKASLNEKIIAGYAAKPGVYFSADPTHQATHGYPLDYENFRVFYAISKANYEIEKNNILDVTKIICRELGLTL